MLNWSKAYFLTILYIRKTWQKGSYEN